jgi:hypothetical protein
VLQEETEEADQDEDDRHGDQPPAGRGGHHIADIAAEQVERAVREVDVAHQAEDQGEARGHKEIERAQRQPAENGVGEDALAAQHLFHARAPRCEEQPQQCRHQQREDDRPHRMATREVSHEGSGSGRASRSRSTSAGSARVHGQAAGLRLRWSRNEGGLDEAR